MGGGLMQLVAYGAQDVYLTGNPQITFFKVVYRRHTNFSIECIETPIENANFGNTTNVQLLRNGDLAHKMYIKTTLPSLPYNYVYCKNPGYALLKSIECTIGGSKIDKQYGLLYNAWYELTHTHDQEEGYNQMLGNVPELTNIYYTDNRMTFTQTTNGINYGTPEYTIYIPLQFWFNRNPGLALPLIALQYHEVRFIIEFEKLDMIICCLESEKQTVDLSLKNTSLLTDFIFLDQEERRRMAQTGHEYMIEQVQYNDGESITSTNQKFTLDFNHPCKEIVWLNKCGLFSARNTYFADYYNDINETLDFAATNIVLQMISYLTDTDDPTLYTTSDGWYKISDFIGNPTITSNATQVYIISDNSILDKNINIIIYNKDIVNRSFDNSRKYYINTKMFQYENNNLCDDIREFTLNFSIEDNETKLHYPTTGIYLLKDIFNVKHSLKIEDISIPVTKFTTKTNYNPNKNINIYSRHPSNYGLDLAGNGNFINSAKIQLNGHDRFEVQSGDYFNYVQPSQHHTRTPSNGIYSYSFGLLPEQHQPSGTCNLSRIDTALLILTFKDNLRSKFPQRLIQISNMLENSFVHICVCNYNVLRVMSGMCGVAYAN
jgi:hypothetical protein